MRLRVSERIAFEEPSFFVVFVGTYKERTQQALSGWWKGIEQLRDSRLRSAGKCGKYVGFDSFGQFWEKKFFFHEKINYICSENLNLNEMFNLKL